MGPASAPGTDEGEQLNLNRALILLEKQYGSGLKAAAALGIAPGQWYKLKNGDIKIPHPPTLAKLGLKVTYEFDETVRSRSGEALAHVDDNQGAEPRGPLVGGCYDYIEDRSPRPRIG